MEKKQHRIWIDINTAAVRHNFRTIRKKADPAEVMAVVKADAYGCDAETVAEICIHEGASRLGTASVCEAVRLKKKFHVPVQVIGSLTTDEIKPAIQHNIICPVTGMETARRINRAALGLGRTATVHFLVDTGMGRLGVQAENAVREISACMRLRGLRAEGIYSHCPEADTKNSAYTRSQIKCFSAIVRELETGGHTFRYKHLSNSYGVFFYPDAVFNLVRAGIALYGSSVHPDLLAYLKPVFSFYARLVSVRELPKGSSIGYARTHRLTKKTRVGTVSAGYADGIPFRLNRGGRVLVRGTECPVIGRISMDYITVDLSNCPQARFNDKVVLIGRSKDKQITVEDWAKISKSIPYEILCSAGRGKRAVVTIT